MARLNVNPTRMVLASLKKRLNVASRGHKLLKDKRDELMKTFLDLARENKVLREEVESMIDGVYQNFAIANAVMSSQAVEEALMYPKQGVIVNVDKKNVMSVDVPVFDFETTTNDVTDIYSYGFATTSGELDAAISELSSFRIDGSNREKHHGVFYFPSEGSKKVLLFPLLFNRLLPDGLPANTKGFRFTR